MPTLRPIKIPIQGVDQFSKVMNKAGAKIQRMGQGMKSAGRAMTIGLTLPAVLLGGSMLKTAGDFQMSMNRVKAITSATGDELSGLTKKARELGATTQFTASDAAEGMGNLALAGFKTNEIMASIGGTMTLAAAGQMELAQASDISASILRGFGLEAKETGRLNDVLVNTFTNTNTTLSELGEGMKFVATIASSMSIPLEEVSAAMGLLGNVGLKGAMAGTALRGALAKIANPSREAVAILRKLNIRKEDVMDSKGNVRGLIEVVEAMEKAGAGASEMLAIFGQRAGPGMAGLVSQGSEALRAMTEKVKTQGTAQKVAKVQMEGFNGAMKKMKSAFQEMGIAVADSGLLEFATKFATKLADMFRKISESNPAMLKWGTILVAVAAAIGPLLVFLGTMVGLIGSLVVLFSAPAFIAAMASLGGLAVALAPVLIPLALIVAAIIIWNRVFGQIADNWQMFVDTFTDFELFAKTMKNFILDITGVGAVWDFLSGLGGGSAAGAETGAAGAVAGAAGSATQKTEVDVNFTNAPPGTRPEVISGSNVNLSTDLGLMPAGG
jgi:TP901 family phage tail tape measure protein